MFFLIQRIVFAEANKVILLFILISLQIHFNLREEIKGLFKSQPPCSRIK